MESVALVTDRPGLRDTMRRALHSLADIHPISSAEWRRRAFRVRPAQLVILDVAGASAPGALIGVAETWPGGFAGRLIAILGAGDADRYRPNLIADDLLVEPFSEAEAALRVRNLLWRAREGARAGEMRHGGFHLDASRYEASVDGLPLRLTYKEYELLRLLASHPGRVYSREALLNLIWGADYLGGIRTVDVHVRRLRVKLGPKYASCIGTVRNVGYRFQSPDAITVP